ncbi:hypothetical protein CYMTET_19754 [Cymbomonas tetramitiformis]|uniref:Uncharacterized protein n=1 Tax=Cymbomonas tetramitiformis TaxID=36881 RepID=A0AAE0L4K0_9CHLO|nr:hypothetical protein CYMTET_19754 [Cymbomonas tetramitiformis]
MIFASSKLGRYRDDLHAVFDDKIRLAHELLPLLRQHLESHSHWSVNRVYELLFRRNLTRREGELISQWAAGEHTLQRGWGWDNEKQDRRKGYHPHRYPGKLTRWNESVQLDDEERELLTGIPNSPPYSPKDLTSPASYKAFARLFLLNRMDGEWEAIINEAMEDEGTTEIARQSQANVSMTEAAQQTPKAAAKQPFTTANTEELMRGEAEPPHVAGPK